VALVAAGAALAQAPQARPPSQLRERRAHFGELVQLDGSHHEWFEKLAGRCCLMKLIDDLREDLERFREVTMSTYLEQPSQRLRETAASRS